MTAIDIGEENRKALEASKVYLKWLIDADIIAFDVAEFQWKEGEQPFDDTHNVEDFYMCISGRAFKRIYYMGG